MNGIPSLMLRHIVAGVTLIPSFPLFSTHTQHALWRSWAILSLIMARLVHYARTDGIGCGPWGCTGALDGPAIVPALPALFRPALPQCLEFGARLASVYCS